PESAGIEPARPAPGTADYRREVLEAGRSPRELPHRLSTLKHALEVDPRPILLARSQLATNGCVIPLESRRPGVDHDLRSKELPSRGRLADELQVSASHVIVGRSEVPLPGLQSRVFPPPLAFGNKQSTASKRSDRAASRSGPVSGERFQG